MKRLMLLAMAVGMSAAQCEAMSEESGRLNQKGLQLLRACRKQTKDGNVLLSPFSVDSAFSMLWLGSKGATRDEIAAVLGLPDTVDFLAQANRRLSASRDPEILTSNSIWVDRHMPLARAYSDLVDRHFPRGVFDFDNTDGTGTAKRVNAYVSERTKGLIPVLVSAESIEPYKNTVERGTGLILLNTLYFKGWWQDKFDREKTMHDFDFNWLNGRAGKVEMMRDTREASYAEGVDYQALSLPYRFRSRSSATSVACDFVAVLPTPALDVENLLARLGEGNAFGKLLSSMKSREVEIWMPKLDVESCISLVDGLRALGMKRAFEKHIDSFPAITEGKDDIFVERVSEVAHAVHIKIDEEKTEAAAATAITCRAVSACAQMTPPTPVFKADHPYLGFIVDRETGLILFAGMFRTMGKDVHSAPDVVALEAREAERRAEFAEAQRWYEARFRE